MTPPPYTVSLPPPSHTSEHCCPETVSVHSHPVAGLGAPRVPGSVLAGGSGGAAVWQWPGLTHPAACVSHRQNVWFQKKQMQPPNANTLINCCILPFIESQNHRMVWVGRDLKDHLFPTPLPWAGTSSTRPGCSELHPTWPWALPGRGQPQLLWAACPSASPPSWGRISS